MNTEAATKPDEYFDTAFSPMEEKLYQAMHLQHGKDISISSLYDMLRFPEKSEDKTPREVQQYVGAYVSRVNKRLGRTAITPGELKRTYRFTRKDA